MSKSRNEALATLEQIMPILLESCKTDMELRSRVLASPKATVESFFDVSLPQDFTLRFLENSKAGVTIILPKFDSSELSDEELEAAAGGRGVLIDQFASKAGGSGILTEPPLNEDKDKTFL